MRIVVIATLVSILAMLNGCAAMNYPQYATQQGTVYQKQAEADKAVAEALSKAVTSSDDRTRDMAVMALFLRSVLAKPYAIEAPREGAFERGVGLAVSGLPYIGLAREFGRAMRGHGGQQTNVSISGSQGVGVGTGGGTGTGSWTDRHDISNSYNDDHSSSSSGGTP